MKNSIVIKFFAIVLCALFLLGTVASGIGIIALSQSNLYQQSVDDLYDQSIRDLSDAFAGQIAARYTSRVLGECPEEILEFYGGIFIDGYYGYTLYDPQGNVVEELEAPDSSKARTVTIPVTGRSYMKLISTEPLVQHYPVETVGQDGSAFVNNIPYDGIPVHRMEIAYLGTDLTDGIAATQSPLGELYSHGDGTVSFCSYDNVPFITRDGTVSAIAFYDAQGQLLYMASGVDQGVGTVYIGAGNHVYFDSYSEDLLNVTMPPDRDGDYVYSAIPYEGAEVHRVEFYYLGSNGEVSPPENFDHSGNALGRLFTAENGTVMFLSSDPALLSTQGGTVVRAIFYDLHDGLLYETYCPSGAGNVADTGSGYAIFESWLEIYQVPNSAGETEPTEAPTEIPTETPTETPTEPVIQPPTEAPVPEIPQMVTDNLERLGIQVATVTIFDEHNYTSDIERATPFGYLYPNPDGTVTFQSYDPMEIPEHVKPINRIAFLNAEGHLLYEVQAPDGVGEFSLDGAGRLTFVTTVTAANIASTETKNTGTAGEDATEAAEDTAESAAKAAADAPQETVIPSNANIIADVTEPVSEIAGVQVNTTQYWDDEAQTHIVAEYVYEDMPEGYTVVLTLLPGAYEMDQFYDLLTVLWRYRKELFFVMGGCVLLFAITAVYLCCAAGRKPGREELHAEGLNRLSLDVYLAGGGLAICSLLYLGIEGGYYLLRSNNKVLIPFAVILGYAAALIIVGFSFACAAQFKTPGGYWWRNTLIARVIRLLIGFGRWLERFLAKRFFPSLGKVFKFCWHGGKKLCIALYRYTDRFLNWFVRFSVRWIKRLWKYLSLFAVVAFRGLEKALIWLGKGIGKIAQRTHAWLHAFLSLLPVTWQWLLVGLTLLLILALSLATRNEFFLGVSIVYGIGLVVYGSHCFGLLWDSTRKISKGDLDTKVDDKLMIGAFKNFAEDLNALSDVAVIAAQKQLKSERMKTELITNVSHDIKTPLTSIINYVDLLQKPHNDEEQEIYLEVLARQSQQMKKLLEDLIEMSKASTGNMTVYLSRLNVSETISQAIGEFSDKLEAAQLIPVIRQPEDALYVRADGRLVWRVLSNILSNTVKYALPGTRVYIDVTREEDNVLISVKNISREELNVQADELMERFVRGDASRNTEGSGLGLNIARSLMEIQKGKLDLLVDGDLFKVILTLPVSEE